MNAKTRDAIAALEDMSVGQLRECYLEVFGEVARTRNKQFLRKRVAWRIQALAEGDLSARARRRAEEIANDADLRIRAPRQVATTLEPERMVTATVQPGRDPRLPMPGTVLKRKYKGQVIRAMVFDNGFEYGGEIFESLSALATHITGTRWNGFQFFGINRKGGTHED